MRFALSWATSIALTLAVAAEAQAQSGDQRGLPAPLFSTIDENGVEIASGRHIGQVQGPRIGPDFAQLDYAYRRVLEATFQDNRRAYVERDSSSPIPYARGYTVVTPNATASFQLLMGGNVIPWHVRGGEILESPSSAPKFTDRDGTIYNFAYIGSTPGYERYYVTSIIKPNNERLYYSYSANYPHEPQISAIVSSAGYMIKFDLPSYTITTLNRGIDYCSSEPGRCQFSRSWPSITYSPGYITDQMGRRTHVSQSNYSGALTTPEGDVSGGHSVSVVYGSGYTTDQNWYYWSSGHVVSLTNAQGTWSYTYKSPVAHIPLSEVGYANEKIVYATRTGPDNAIVSFVTKFGSLSSITDQLGRTTNLDVVIRDYGATTPEEGRIMKVTYPEGNYDDYTYDARGNITLIEHHPKPGSGMAVTSEIASYPSTCANPKTCNQPEYVVDVRGNRTDYTYYDWGGIKSEWGPAVDGSRPLLRWTYVQRYAAVKTASGTLVNGEAPIWRPYERIMCRTSSNGDGTGCAVSGDEEVTRYEYGQDGTLTAPMIVGRVDDATGAALRSCFTYDVLGNKTSETSPRAGAVSCL